MKLLLLLFAFVYLFVCTVDNISARGLWEECIDVLERTIISSLSLKHKKCGVPTITDCHKICYDKSFDECNAYTFYQDGGFCHMYSLESDTLYAFKVESDMDVVSVRMKPECFGKSRKSRQVQTPAPGIIFVSTPTPAKRYTSSVVFNISGGGAKRTKTRRVQQTIRRVTRKPLQMQYEQYMDVGMPMMTMAPVRPRDSNMTSSVVSSASIGGSEGSMTSSGGSGGCTGSSCPIGGSGSSSSSGTGCTGSSCPIGGSGSSSSSGTGCTGPICPMSGSSGGSYSSSSGQTGMVAGSGEPGSPGACQGPDCPMSGSPGSPGFCEGGICSTTGATDQPDTDSTDDPTDGGDETDPPDTEGGEPGSPGGPSMGTETSTEIPVASVAPSMTTSGTGPIGPAVTYGVLPTPGPTPVQSTKPPIEQSTVLVGPAVTEQSTQPAIEQTTRSSVPGFPTGKEYPVFPVTHVFIPFGTTDEDITFTLTPPAQWQQWGPWSSCSKMCGTGMTLRTRVCSAASGCEGCTSEMKICNPQSCCSPWSEWSPCSATCGQGLQKRNRKCIVEDPTLPAGYTSKETVETRCCTAEKTTCSVWSRWADWSSCTVSCGGGKKTRTRLCEPTAGDCPGASNETESCNDQACPDWSKWGEWSACSASCGGGFQFRSRTCSGGAACPGDSRDKRDCNNVNCPHWSDWGEWGQCSQSCNGGEMTRNRTCINDPKFCTGTNATLPVCVCETATEKPMAVDTCNHIKCPVPGAWSDWSNCTRPCGGGSQNRTRPCIIDTNYCTLDKMNEKVCMCPDITSEKRDCNSMTCALWSEWAPWGDCSVSCGNGTSVRSRTCTADPAVCTKSDMVDNPACRCEGKDSDSKDCVQAECYTWSSWSKWSECTVLCGGGSRNRTRDCPIPGSCPGLNDITDICNMIPCPDWGDWSPWSDCSESCGGGQRSRTRACPIPGACSPGEEYEFDAKPCNPHECPSWTQWLEWTKCSRTCGPGNRHRRRKCEPVDDGCLGSDEQVEPCIMQACTLSTEWSRWSPCTATCGGGVRSRSRVKCPSGPPACPIEQNTSKCNEQACPLWTQWNQWGTCSKTCGGGQRLRQRTCPVVNGCLGQNSEIDPQPCNNFGCGRSKARARRR